MIKAINEYAEQHSIVIDNFEMQSAKAFCIEINGKYYIAIDKQKFKSQSEINSALIHEIGHIEAGALYTAHSAPTFQKKCEQQADEWAVTHFINKSDLEGYLFNNMPLQAIAEAMQITVDYVKMAIDYYSLAEMNNKSYNNSRYLINLVC